MSEVVMRPRLRRRPTPVQRRPVAVEALRPNFYDALAATRARVARGWCQKAFGRNCWGEVAEGAPVVAHCLLAALAGVLADDHPEPHREAWLALYGPLKKLLATAILAKEELGWEIGKPPTDGQVVQAWNDQPGRTQAEVLAFLDALLDEL